MFKYFAIGLIILAGAGVVWFMSGDENLFVRTIAVSAGIPLFLAGILTGAFVSGDRNRANFHTESTQGRSFRKSLTLKLVVISSPSDVMFVIMLVDYWMTS
ncbi:DUF5316 domain-containing protein [Halobacillus sp. A1]|uniref:DUF5316 family protein n=1 Tax=Halobacillus sp. A1 TaxID=2880262 RepID=UPI0020A6A461|nr:DUF5316 family protein [Halobacillus sp. A1]MCP3032999.1 DUF5316 domain-containing protein [Halobacillus sp. A1]